MEHTVFQQKLLPSMLNKDSRWERGSDLARLDYSFGLCFLQHKNTQQERNTWFRSQFCSWAHSVLLKILREQSDGKWLVHMVGGHLKPSCSFLPYEANMTVFETQERKPNNLLPLIRLFFPSIVYAVIFCLQKKTNETVLQYGFKIAWELSTTKDDGLGNTHMRQLRFLPEPYVTFL